MSQGTTSEQGTSLGSIVFAGGGTTGHVSPMLAMAEELRKKYPDTIITMIGTDDGLEKQLVPAAGFALETIDKVPLPRSLNLDLFKVPFKLKRTSSAAATILEKVGADLVVGVGGYVCTPVYMAASKRGIPVIIHEANKRAGLANRVGAKRALYVATAYKETILGDKSKHVGMPMRAEISKAHRGQGQQEARTILGLDPEKKTLVISGGSSGAVSINEAIAAAAQPLLEAGLQIFHLTGHAKTLDAAEFPAVASPHYHQQEYLDDMVNAYLAADLMVTRAGAGTVFELTAVGVPTIFVPLAIGNGEQERNVQHLKETKAATVVLNSDFNSAWVQQNLLSIIQDDALLEEQSRLMAEHGIDDAAEKMVGLIEEICR